MGASERPQQVSLAAHLPTDRSINRQMRMRLCMRMCLRITHQGDHAVENGGVPDLAAKHLVGVAAQQVVDGAAQGVQDQALLSATQQAEDRD